MRDGVLSLKQLRALSAIWREGSLTAAAAALHLTVPAVSIQLRNLEANVGAKLVRRGPEGQASLTPAGQEVLGAAQKIDQAIAGCRDRLRALNAGKMGHVAVGVVSTGKYFAPGLIVRAGKEMPDIEFALKVGNREQIIAALASQSIDVAIMGRPPVSPPVIAEALGPHPHLLIAPLGHPLSKRARVEPKHVLGEVFLCREIGSGTRTLTDQYLMSIGDGTPHKMLEISSNETIKQGVIAGLGLAIISAHTIAAELSSRRLSIVAMPGLPIMRHWYAIHRSDEALSVAAAMFLRFLKQTKGDFLPALPLVAASRKQRGRRAQV